MRQRLRSAAGLSNGWPAEPLFAPDPAVEVRTFPAGTVSTVELAVPHPVEDPRTEQSLTRLRGELLPAALAELPDAEAAVAGSPRTTSTTPNSSDSGCRGRSGWWCC